ncbi:MAG TPA: peptidoglycan editing factor PgeF [Vicinamibacterales bacterium]|nr:peptidoglycan editing factor PgeF [Vicinamibacterales bacterium]
MTEPQPNRAFEWTQAPWGRVLRCVPLVAAADHFFTARDLTLRDDPGEWTAVAAAIGVDRDNLLLVRQVHGAGVAVASADRPRPWPRPEADAIVSNDATAAAVVCVADCVPILLSDETGQAVAAIHAGWRGTVQRAAIEGVAALQARYGIRPERLIAAIGPCIGPCCYEVGESVVEGFRAAGHHAAMIAQWFSPRGGGKFYLDLWQATRDQLEGAGLPPSSIHIAELCTKTHAEVLHSYRIDGARAGRMAAVIRASGRVRRSY